MPHEIAQVLNPDNPGQWGNDYGTFKQFDVVLTTGEKAEVSTKVKGDGSWYAPAVGDKYQDLIQQGGTFPAKLKTKLKDDGTAFSNTGQQAQPAQQQMGGQPQNSQQQATQPRSQGKPDEAYWQAQNAMKGRSAAQDRAVGYLQAQAAIIERLPEPSQQSVVSALTNRREMALLVDWFALDVTRAGDRGSPVLTDQERVGELGARMEPQADTSDLQPAQPVQQQAQAAGGDDEVPF